MLEAESLPNTELRTKKRRKVTPQSNGENVHLPSGDDGGGELDAVVPAVVASRDAHETVDELKTAADDTSDQASKQSQVIVEIRQEGQKNGTTTLEGFVSSGAAKFRKKVMAFAAGAVPSTADWLKMSDLCCNTLRSQGFFYHSTAVSSANAQVLVFSSVSAQQYARPKDDPGFVKAVAHADEAHNSAAQKAPEVAMQVAENEGDRARNEVAMQSKPNIVAPADESVPTTGTVKADNDSDLPDLVQAHDVTHDTDVGDIAQAITDPRSTDLTDPTAKTRIDDAPYIGWLIEDYIRPDTLRAQRNRGVRRFVAPETYSMPIPEVGHNPGAYNPLAEKSQNAPLTEGTMISGKPPRFQGFTDCLQGSVPNQDLRNIYKSLVSYTIEAAPPRNNASLDFGDFFMTGSSTERLF